MQFRLPKFFCRKVSSGNNVRSVLHLSKPNGIPRDTLKHAKTARKARKGWTLETGFSLIFHLREKFIGQ